MCGLDVCSCSHKSHPIRVRHCISVWANKKTDVEMVLKSGLLVHGLPVTKVAELVDAAAVLWPALCRHARCDRPSF